MGFWQQGRRGRYPWLLVMVLLVLPNLTHAASSRAEQALGKMDSNGDGQLSAKEWKKKKIFKEVDLDGDGYVSLSELKARFGEPDDAIQTEPQGIMPSGPSGANRSAGQSELQGRPDPVSMSAIRRSRRDDVRHQKARGLFETGLKPVWPEGVKCRGIDEWFAKDYTPVRPKESYHGGIDMPAPFGTPIYAIMDGEVIALYEGTRSPRGIEVVLRHTPAQSGLPLYIYSRYTHFKTMPALRVGQPMKMGDRLGLTGNSGVLGCELKGGNCTGKSRRPALHFDLLYSTDARYFDTGTIIIPFEAYWMDPNALYRNAMPVDSVAMQAMPETQKAVDIPYRLDNGTLFPADTRMIWPYSCDEE